LSLIPVSEFLSLSRFSQ